MKREGEERDPGYLIPILKRLMQVQHLPRL